MVGGKEETKEIKWDLKSNAMGWDVLVGKWIVLFLSPSRNGEGQGKSNGTLLYNYWRDGTGCSNGFWA